MGMQLIDKASRAYSNITPTALFIFDHHSDCPVYILASLPLPGSYSCITPSPLLIFRAQFATNITIDNTPIPLQQECTTNP